MRALGLYAIATTLVVSTGCQQEPPSAPRGSTTELEPTTPSSPDTELDPSSPTAPDTEVPEQSWPSASSTPSACQVRLTATVGSGEHTRTVQVYAQNLTTEALTFEIPERCPHGLIDFEGLGAGYDYYSTCNAGACKDWPSVRRITLQPGQRQLIAGTQLSPKGSTCNGPLAPGKHTLRPVPPTSSVTLCSEPTTFDIQAPLAPKEVRARSNDPYFCQDSADCTLSCPTAPGCCGDTCGCTHAINIRHKEAYEANYPNTCTKPPCPAMACAYQPAHFAVCINNRCVGSRTMTGY